MQSASHLGRLVDPDPRDRSYPARPLLAAAPVERPAYRYHRTGPTLNQGATGTCVGHGWAQKVLSALVMQPSPDPFTLYREACLRDPWSDNDSGDLQFGTSVRAGAQALQERGLISEYRWTWSADEMLDLLLAGVTGVLVVGTNWYRGQSLLSPGALMRLTGPIDGGHCYCIVGGNRERGLLRVLNSHGAEYGDGGRAWISGEDMQRLLDEDGECCVAVEIRRQP